MKLTKEQRAELVKTIVLKLMELKADGGMSWKASFGLSMLMAYLEEEMKQRG